MDQQQPITAEWCQKMDRRLKWLKHLGVMDKIDLHCGSDGLPCYVGMPLEHDTFLAPTVEIPSAIAPTIVAPASESSSGSSIRITSDLFENIVEDLQSRSSCTHVAWQLTVIKLQLMHERTPPILHVLNELESAVKACKSGLDAVTALSATPDPKILLKGLRQMEIWLVPLQCRLIGIQSGQASSVHWWEDYGKRAVELFNNDDLYHCINRTYYALGSACTMYDFSMIDASTRALTEQFIPTIEKFLRMQQNQNVLTKVEHHLSQLRADMEQDLDEGKDVVV
ncbi:hypothetical protein NW762_011487 [Fusarium torreyae]|uniref:Uncharacterized protein n=1 Tax=Fusarium torreyae TaxID=1237075 RepID=A0A9W8RTP3_9HYPO|nr:hypothetical protein NW762_011487 [Fusarium torreyae]